MREPSKPTEAGSSIAGLSPEQFSKEMASLCEFAVADPEAAHNLADRLLCAVLVSHGYADGIAHFRRMDKWYA